MSNTIEIDLNDYITDDERREMARDVFKAACARACQQDFERIISNSAYHMVGELVDAHFDGSMVEVLKTNAIKVINNLSSTTVFSPPNAWDRASSKGYDHLQSLLDEQKPLIAQRLTALIQNMDVDHLREIIERQIGEVIISKLTGRIDHE